jgi:translation initiation factor IF-3
MTIRARMNDEIDADRVQVIDKHGLNLGVMDIASALQMAADAGLNLVEIAPAAVPSVCKLTDKR